MLFSTEMHVPIAGELLLRLAHQSIQASFDIGEAFADMAHESGIEGSGEEMCAAAVGDVAVGRVVLEEIGFGLESLVHRLAALDVLLGAIDDADESQLQRVDAA